MGIYNAIYVMCNILGSYVVYKFFHLFYLDEDVKSRKWEMLLYGIYSVGITVIYFLSDVPLVMLISNIIGFLIISLIYAGNMLKRILSSVTIYLVLMVIETLVAILSGYTDDSVFNQNEYTWIFGIVASKIFSYAIILILSNFKNLRYNLNVPKYQWMLFLIVPIFTLYLLILVLHAKGYSHLVETSAIFIVFILNFIMLWQYDYTIKNTKKEYESLILLRENQYYEKQLEIVKNSALSMQTFRHDMRNHLIVLNEMAEKENVLDMKEYVSKMIDTSDLSNVQILTGYMAIDSLLNYKIFEADKKDIVINLDVKVPNQIKLPSYELVIILGNILDNAIAAVVNADDKTIRLMIRYSKGRIIIKEENAYKDTLKFDKSGLIVTNKKDNVNHGYGLKSIDMQIKKLDGVMKIQAENGMFLILIIFCI